MRPFNFLHGKRIIWATYFRVFCDGGYCIYRIIPRVHRTYYDPHWNMKGFRVYWLGREFNFSFGKDINRLYRD